MSHPRTKKFELSAKYQPAGQQPQAIAALIDGLTANEAKQLLLGVTGSGKTFTVANVIQSAQRPTLIMAHNKTLAAQLYGEMKAFFPKNSVEYFVSYYDYYQPEAYVPTTDTFIEKDASINAHIEQMRLSATKALLERQDVIIIATVSAIYGLGDPQSYLKMMLHVSRGDLLDQRQLLRRLSSMQYTRNEMDLIRGTYRVKGDVIDIFPAESAREAIRIELFDDEVEAIRELDPLTGQVLRNLPRTSIYPKTHYVTPREKIVKTIALIKTELKERLDYLRKNDKLVEAQRLEQRTQFDIEMMLELGYCSGIENYSRYLAERQAGEPPPTLFSYLPDNALLVVDESHVTLPQLSAMHKGDRSRKENLVSYGFRLPSALDNRPLRFEEFTELSPQTIYISATPGPYEIEQASQVIELIVRPTGLLDPEIDIRPVASQVDDLLSEINACVASNSRVLATTLTKRMAEDLTEYLIEHNIKVRYLHASVDTVERMEILRCLRLGEIDVVVGINLLREGLDLPEVALVAILDADKEGFLRSTRSLIQTIGRAARNAQGRVIMYADKVTDSMKRAMEETQRRRQIQAAFNQQHNIKPTTITSPIKDVMEGASNYQPMTKRPSKEKATAINESSPNYALNLSPKQLAKKLENMKRTMYKHAENLEFEKAAQLRDRIEKLQQQVLLN